MFLRTSNIKSGPSNSHWMDTLGSQAGSTISETHIYVASKNQQHTVELTPDHADLPSWLNFGTSESHCCVAINGSATCDLSEAIKNRKIAIQITPDGHTLLPAQLNNLGFPYSRRFECTGDLEDIFEAIRNQRAIQLTPDGHADLPGWLGNFRIVSMHGRPG